MDCDKLRDLIAAAFRGVKLDGGTSIRQGEVCDNYGKDNDGREVSKIEFAAIPRSEITDDWTSLPLAELERYPYLAYLDAKGFRYYIPAFLLSLLENSQGASMRVISTLSSIYPKREHWSHHMEHYELLNETQRSAIATFLYHISCDERLEEEDRYLISRALNAYWHQFVPHDEE